jgi:hypothetical protein
MALLNWKWNKKATSIVTRGAIAPVHDEGELLVLVLRLLRENACGSDFPRDMHRVGSNSKWKIQKLVINLRQSS